MLLLLIILNASRLGMICNAVSLRGLLALMLVFVELH